MTLDREPSCDARTLRERHKVFARMGLDIVDRLKARAEGEDILRDTLQYLRGFVDTLCAAATAESARGELAYMDNELRGLTSLLDTRVSALESWLLAGKRPS